ncbi:gastrula zinc finger protein XlCGF57.1-like isoform X2 [Leguminivora glycinivorella]|uniref:gastrula zinc finger protein XlCGF57.1-like isoform X1 n=1 Tax=Leguminivora glycinivorella TaxID=1035111 RepID=UPI00200E2DA1|nr:gastrula zinc finger protein XlCGF57.1-like isoform X1 [Leguminivora glycinivorella]XP_048003507.1 gastrula zinc finger protein XlCGF57.1-like isoform X2 [Leguminivora glycinivorella]
MDAEDDKYFGLCKCCFQDGSFRSLWAEHEDNGVVQNYGEMLNECFSLQWLKPDNDQLDQICDECSKRTIDAYSFRQLILSSQKQLVSCTEPEVTEVLDAESGEITVIIKHETEEFEDYEEAEYEEVEYLETEDGREFNVEILNAEEEHVDDPDYYPEVPIKQETRWRPKKKRGERKRTYKNYTAEDLKQSFEAAKSGRMSVAEAAAAYNVPRKTVAARLLNDRRGIPIFTKTEKDDGLIKEVKTLLTYTNMTPYKSRTAHYHCAYCGTEGPMFEDTDELRTHTRTQHAGERTKAVENFLRPLWLNEILKVDIENLLCTVCCTALLTWNDMFKHLTEKHNLIFEEAYTRVIPYILSPEIHCALCKTRFPNYHHLDAHMNAHYNNYVCSECGDTFLASSRLKKHLKIHDTGRFVCDECGKVFTLDKYRKKHVELVHKLEHKIQCLYCPEKFLNTYPRHLHVLEHHKEKVKSITCELCGRIFDWRPYFLAHVRRTHNNEKNYSCTVCNRRFFLKTELKRHEMAAHLKVKPKCRAVAQLPNPKPGKYACSFCGKQYSNKNCLITHFNTHEVVLDVDQLKAITEKCEVSKSGLSTSIDS